MKNKIIAFDLDGTLLDSNNAIIGGKQTLDLLKKFQQQGHILVVCTGRLDHDILKVIEKHHLHISERVSQNGAVHSNLGFCESILINKEEALDVLNYLKNQDIRVELNTISQRFWLSKREPSFPKELYDSHCIVENYEDIIRYQPAILFLVIGDAKKLDDIAKYVDQNYSYIKAVKTSETSLEILNKNVSKGEILQQLYPQHDIYAIGDSPNDFEMFKVSKEAYLVSKLPCPYQVTYKENILEALLDIEKKLKEGEQ